MTASDIKPLPKAIAIKVRVDGSAVAIVKTNLIGPKSARMSSELLPLTQGSYVELEFFDGADRLLLPAIVVDVGEDHLTFEYEQTGQTFGHWLKIQSRVAKESGKSKVK